jgi:hypothetical protein
MSRNVWKGQMPALLTRTSILEKAFTASVTICATLGLRRRREEGTHGFGCFRVPDITGYQYRLSTVRFDDLLDGLCIFERTLSEMMQNNICAMSRRGCAASSS